MQHFNLGRLVFDHIPGHAESSTLKLVVGYPSFIFGILKDQSGFLMLQTDAFSSPPCEMRLNPKLFKGLQKIEGV